MKTEFTPAFLRDLRKLPDAAVGEQVRDAILTVEQAADLRSVPNLKKMTGAGDPATASAPVTTGSGCG